ncbi:MAG: holo-ACP synthase [Solirubrobacteraceae bacterium]|nr:holo-ACP synthase [Solirubrobacteraceae bacterium]
MLGIDLIEVDRMAAALERTPNLRARLFTPGEQAYADGQAVPARHYAARFCAKEAVVKALELASWDALDIEVVHKPTGAPGIVLHGPLTDRGPIALSITHTRASAAAVAMVVPA